MYKNLRAEALGVSGRQSELIELALTYGFKGLDLDVASLTKRVASQGKEYACRFLTSAKIRIGGFELPVRWQGPEIDFKADLANLEQVAQVAAAVGANRCFTTVMSASDDRPYPENYEMHRSRIGEVADLLARQKIRLGLGFQAAASFREGHEFSFIHKVEPLLTLIRDIGRSNVGIVLDLWNWIVGGGGLDQIHDLTRDQIVIVRIADVPADADLATITPDQRLLPGESETSLVVPVLSSLADKQYQGPITPFPHTSRFTGMTRDAIVQRVGAAIDQQFRAAGLSKSAKAAVAAES